MTRYTVILPYIKAYAVTDKSLCRWTYNYQKAKKNADAIGGIVVDADEFSKNPNKFYDANRSV